MMYSKPLQTFFPILITQILTVYMSHISFFMKFHKLFTQFSMLQGRICNCDTHQRRFSPTLGTKLEIFINISSIEKNSIGTKNPSPIFFHPTYTLQHRKILENYVFHDQITYTHWESEALKQYKKSEEVLNTFLIST